MFIYLLIYVFINLLLYWFINLLISLAPIGSPRAAQPIWARVGRADTTSLLTDLLPLSYPDLLLTRYSCHCDNRASAAVCARLGSTIYKTYKIYNLYKNIQNIPNIQNI